jgi:hypothetical protein
MAEEPPPRLEVKPAKLEQAVELEAPMPAAPKVEVEEEMPEAPAKKKPARAHKKRRNARRSKPEKQTEAAAPPAPKAEPPPPEPPPPVKEAPAYGTLQVGSDKWVDVYVDGERVGRAPDRTQYPLLPGEHRLRAEKPDSNCLPFERTFTITAGETTRVRLKVVCP